MQARLWLLSFFMCFGVGCSPVPAAETKQAAHSGDDRFVDTRRSETRHLEAVAGEAYSNEADAPAMLD